MQLGVQVENMLTTSKFCFTWHFFECGGICIWKKKREKGKATLNCYKSLVHWNEYPVRQQTALSY